MRAQLVKRKEDYAMMNVIFTQSKWDEATDSPIKSEEADMIELLDPYHWVTEEGAWYYVTTTPVFHKFKDGNGKLCKEVMLFIMKATLEEDTNV